MFDLRDHSQPCATCGRYSPEVDHGYLELQATCVECGGSGGRAVIIDYDAALGAWQDTPLTTCGECLGDGKIVVGTLLSGVGNQLRTMECHDCNGAGSVLNEGVALMNAILAAVGDTDDGST